METVQIDELEHNLSKYIDMAKTGETLSIVEQNKEIFQIVPVPQAPKALRPFGLCKGQFVVPDDFDDPLPEEILRSFEGEL